MAPPPRWATTALRYLAPILVVILIAQYLLGLWTNLYTTAVFTSNSSSPSLDWHYDLGFILGILGIVAIVFAGLTRRLDLVAISVLLFVGILVAGIAGGDFVGSQPNPANMSPLMGGMFLVALFAAMGLSFRSWVGSSLWPEKPPTPSSA